MVAALFQVHHHVEQRHLVSSSSGVQGLKVPREDELVVLPELRETNKINIHVHGKYILF